MHRYISPRLKNRLLCNSVKQFHHQPIQYQLFRKYHKQNYHKIFITNLFIPTCLASILLQQTTNSTSNNESNKILQNPQINQIHQTSLTNNNNSSSTKTYFPNSSLNSSINSTSLHNTSHNYTTQQYTKTPPILDINTQTLPMGSSPESHTLSLNSNVPSIQSKNSSSNKFFSRPMKHIRRLDELNDEFCIFSGTSCEELSNHVSMILQKPLSNCDINTYSDGEISVQYKDSIRGKDVYIIQATCHPIHDNLMQLLLLVSAARRASARNIIVVIPYYGYCRQDRKRGWIIPFDEMSLKSKSSLKKSHNERSSQRETIAASDIAKLLESVGVDHVVTMDIHRRQLQGFYDVSIPVDNVETLRAIIPVLLEKNLYNPVIVCPSDTGVFRAKKLLALLYEEGVTGTIAFVTTRSKHDKTIEFSDLSSHHRINDSGDDNDNDDNENSKYIRNNIYSLASELIGNVGNRDVIIVDDMIDTGARLVNTAHKCKKEGAERIFAFATHGLFSSNAMKLIDNSPIDEVFVCNTIFPPPMTQFQNKNNNKDDGKFVSDKVSYISVGPILAEVIRRIQVKNSLSSMTDIPNL